MDLFAVGEIVKTRGLRGCLKVLCYVETNNTFAELEFVYIEISSGKKNRFVLRKIDVSGKILFIELEGIPDVESAQALVGCKVFCRRICKKNCLRENITGGILSDLMFTMKNGKYIGKIESVFPTGSNDVYVCKGEEREILLPAIADVIRKIDVNRRVMIVRLLEGL